MKDWMMLKNALWKTLNLLNNLIHYFRAEVAKDTNRAADAFKEHCELLAALSERDSEKAEVAARDHIRVTRERTLIDIDFGSPQSENTG